MKKVIGTMMLLAGGMFAAPHVAVQVGIGVPAPVAVVRPACPGPGYTWVDGYYASGGRFVAGYWAPPVVRVQHDMRYNHEVRFDRGHDRDRYEHDRR